MLQTTSLAHTKKTDLSMFDMEALISKLTFRIDRSMVTCISLDFTQLNVHTLDNTVDLRTNVRDIFSS